MKMADYIKDPHTAVFTGPTCFRKSHLVLDLIEEEHKKHYYIIVIFPILRWNRTYHTKDWIRHSDNV